jgi:hypothetical protein
MWPAPGDDRVQHSIDGFAHVLNEDRVAGLHGTLHNSHHVVGSHAHNLRNRVGFENSQPGSITGTSNSHQYWFSGGRNKLHEALCK